jgi:hypothetical protein
MNPTQLELATLAATLPTGTPTERVESALMIWRAAGEVMQPPPADPFNDKQRLTDLLKGLLPTMDSEPDRLAVWREFLPHWERLLFERQKLSQAEKLAKAGLYQGNDLTITDDEIKDRAAETMRTHREFGVREAGDIGDVFRAWRQAVKRQGNVLKGKKGGRPKKVLDKGKTAKKPRK